MWSERRQLLRPSLQDACYSIPAGKCNAVALCSPRPWLHRKHDELCPPSRHAPLPHPSAQALAEGRRWDLVIFDPPKLAPSRKTLEKATRKYRRLNAMAMQVGIWLRCGTGGGWCGAESAVCLWKHCWNKLSVCMCGQHACARAAAAGGDGVEGSARLPGHSMPLHAPLSRTRSSPAPFSPVLQLVEPGGLLMTCSCSGAMSQSGTFVPMLQVGSDSCAGWLQAVGSKLVDAASGCPCAGLGLLLSQCLPVCALICRPPADTREHFPQHPAGSGAGCRAAHHCAAGGGGCARPHARPGLPRGPLPH